MTALASFLGRLAFTVPTSIVTLALIGVVYRKCLTPPPSLATVGGAM